MFVYLLLLTSFVDDCDFVREEFVTFESEFFSGDVESDQQRLLIIKLERLLSILQLEPECAPLRRELEQKVCEDLSVRVLLAEPELWQGLSRRMLNLHWCSTDLSFGPLFQWQNLKPLLQSEEVRRLSDAFFRTKSDDFPARSLVLKSYLHSEDPAAQRLALDILLRLPPSYTDDLFKNDLKAFDAAGVFQDFFFEQRTLSSEVGLRTIRNWMSDPRSRHQVQVWRALSRWGSSASPLFPALIRWVTPELSDLHRAYLGDFFRSLRLQFFPGFEDWLGPDLIFLLSCLHRPARIERLAELLENKKFRKRALENRQVLSQFLTILQRPEFCKDTEFRDQVIEFAKKVFDLPPDEATEGPLRSLLLSLLNVDCDESEQVQVIRSMLLQIDQ